MASTHLHINNTLTVNEPFRLKPLITKSDEVVKLISIIR
jgi:hypothetical protein